MSKEAMKLALEALELSSVTVDSFGVQKKTNEAITALQEALAEPGTWTPEDGLRHQDIRVEMYPPHPTSGMVVGMSKGVRLIHTPTGTTVECDTERSQHRNREVALKKLEEALAKPDFWEGYVPEPVKPAQQEPVTRQYQNRDGVWKDFINEKHYKNTLENGSWPIRNLYTSPPAQRRPLTDEQFNDLVMEHLGPHALTGGKMSVYDAFLKAVRATEAAHNIKENT